MNSIPGCVCETEYAAVVQLRFCKSKSSIFCILGNLNILLHVTKVLSSRRMGRKSGKLKVQNLPQNEFIFLMLSSMFFLHNTKTKFSAKTLLQIRIW